MLLRSSSTPVLGSLLTSVSESPNTHFHDTIFKHCSFSKLPFHHHPQAGCLHLAAVSCSSSPISPSVADLSDHSVKVFRRAQSEGNLEGLSSAYASCSNNDELYELSHAKMVSGRSKRLMLETIPSFSYYGPKGRYEDEEDYEDDDESELDDFLDEEEEEQVENVMNLVSTEQARVIERSWNARFRDDRAPVNEEMYLARGLGIDSDIGNGFGGGGRGGHDSGRSHFLGGDGGDMNQTEEYYKRMLRQNPGNPLFLRNYAQFLYQSKGDLPGAEEYYSRAILADPGDGEILSQYAKLVWELHRDEDRAMAYFKRAAEAAPEDRSVFTVAIFQQANDVLNHFRVCCSHVHAAYAAFLWEVDEDDDEGECQAPHNLNTMPTGFRQGPIASATA